jgi:hypothetical protein
MPTTKDVLGTRGYERLRRAAQTHREDLVLRLGAEVGLRPAEMTRVRLSDVSSHEDHFFLSVRAEDGVAREAYLPAEVEHDLRKYASATDSADDDPLVPVSARRLQMLVGEVADRVPEVGDVSSRDLRWRFAAGLLDDGVPPQVVCALGGWDRLARLEPLLDEPDRDATVAAMADEDGTEASALLHRTVAVAADVGEALTRAATGTEIEQTVCDRLADTEGFRFAWTAERTGDGLTQSCGAGLGSERIQAQLGEFADDLRVALEDHETQVVERSDGALAFVPVTGDTAVSGVLAVGTEAPVDDTERKLLTALGAQAGHAVTAIERKRLLLADVVTELEFDCSDATAFTVGLSGELDCSVDLSGIVPVSGQSLLYYLVVDGAPAADVLAYAVDDPTVTDARLIENYGDGALVEVVVSAAPALTLVESGARVCDLSVEGGAATILVDLPGEADLRPVVDAVVDAYPETTLTAKREAERPVQTDVGFRERFADRLTDRQETVLRAAYHSGYFEWPRGTTAEELADSLDVASPTLHNHLRKAQQALLTEFFTETPSRRLPSLTE